MRFLIITQSRLVHSAIPVCQMHQPVSKNMCYLDRQSNGLPCSPLETARLLLFYA